MDLALQLIISGLATGGVYSLVALGFVLIYKATEVLNFATGEFMLIGAYMSWSLMTIAHVPFWLSLLGAILLAIALGIFIEKLVLRPMVGEPIVAVIMVTIGLSIALKGIVELIFTPQFQSFPQVFPEEPLEVGSFIVPSNMLVGFLIAIVATAFFAAIFRFTRTGIAMRGTADNQQAALSMGIKVHKMFAMAWIFAAVTAALGGIVIGTLSGIHPNLGMIGLKVFPVVILGGMDSIGGAVIAGLIVGVLENLAGTYLEAAHPFFLGIKDIAPYIILVAILMVRPYGLFGKKEIERL